ncbi:rhamnose-containing polysacharide translocation permease [Patulibacter medicamentivorans]|uniref:Transport permease protein n=1 Tax=Patulibacter medicamentivorans TaxID=1097667 RepID=H0E5S6_9ACTN|nr:ABC transporter permease [Patulibacter medicamentivorans]EHN10977.1 rhamnose-containing polysacharide translocation permease [Patulibacter medicamentivorans]
MKLELEPPISADEPAPLREMKGPSALGGGWTRFWSLTWTVAVTEFRLTYFGSALGYLWTLMRPLMMFGVYYVMFTQIVKLGQGITHYPALLLMNIMLFQFFVEATSNAVQSVVARENLVRKMQFPRMVIPLSVVGTSLLNLAVNLVAVFVFVLANGVPIRWTWLLLPLALIPLVMLTVGVSMILAGAFVKYRDVLPVWGVVSQALFYASPVLYTIEKPPDKIRNILEFNPLTGIMEGVRYLIVDPHAPGGITALGGWPQALVPLGLIVGLFAFGLWYFNRQATVAAELL